MIVLEVICHSHSSFTSIPWAFSFFINAIIWCFSVVFVCMYICYVVPWVKLNEWHPGFHGSWSGHSQCFYEWAIYLLPGLHGFGRAWFVGDVITKVPMAAILLGLWMKPAFEWGLVFCGYNGDWFASEIRTQVSVVTVRTDERQDGLVH